jgi:hypothetical protein
MRQPLGASPKKEQPTHDTQLDCPRESHIWRHFCRYVCLPFSSPLYVFVGSRHVFFLILRRLLAFKFLCSTVVRFAESCVLHRPRHENFATTAIIMKIPKLPPPKNYTCTIQVTMVRGFGQCTRNGEAAGKLSINNDNHLVFVSSGRRRHETAHVCVSAFLHSGQKMQKGTCIFGVETNITLPKSLYT